METVSEIVTLENAVFGMLTTALVLSAARLLIGPDIADRVVALDMIAVTTVGIILAYTVLTDEAAFLDGAAIVALIGFLGTVAFARYLERRVRDE